MLTSGAPPSQRVILARGSSLSRPLSPEVVLLIVPVLKGDTKSFLTTQHRPFLESPWVQGPPKASPQGLLGRERGCGRPESLARITGRGRRLLLQASAGVNVKLTSTSPRGGKPAMLRSCWLFRMSRLPRSDVRPLSPSMFCS